MSVLFSVPISRKGSRYVLSATFSLVTLLCSFFLRSRRDRADQNSSHQPRLAAAAAAEALSGKACK